jgi:2-haloacid dehalogenase
MTIGAAGQLRDAGVIRPSVVIFDVVGTLASLDPVRSRLESVGQPTHVFEGWFARLLRDGMALTLSGGYRPFGEVAASALAAHTRGALSVDQINYVTAGFGELTAQPDAVTAVQAAAAAGLRVFTLSNGGHTATRAFLDRAGLTDRVEKVLSIDDIQAWKPARAAYEYATQTADVAPGDAALVAVHSWDIEGARRAGLTTGWCSREEHIRIPVFAAADVSAATLDGVIAALASLPTG